MGKAGQSLKRTLEIYGISQNKLAVTLGVDRSMIFKWYHEQRDPTAETVVEIATALKSINPDAAEEFICLYVGDFLQNQLREINSEYYTKSGFVTPVIL